MIMMWFSWTILVFCVHLFEVFGQNSNDLRYWTCFVACLFKIGQPGIWSISTSNWLIFKRFRNPPTNDVLIESTILLKMKTVFCWMQKHYFIAHVSVMIIYRIISFKVTRLTRINAICMDVLKAIESIINKKTIQFRFNKRSDFMDRKCWSASNRPIIVLNSFEASNGFEKIHF